jgi:hypothetical protein
VTRSELLAEQGAWQDLLEARAWRLLRARARRHIEEARDRLETETPNTLEAARLQGQLAGMRALLGWPEERLSEIAHALVGE